MSKLWAKIRHNKALASSGILALAVVFWTYDCESTVKSSLHPEQRLNRTAFQGEVDTFLALAQSKFESLDRQDAVKQKLFETAVLFGKSGSVNPVGVAMSLGSILGLGAVIDNQRKDVRIKTYKNEANKSSA